MKKKFRRRQRGVVLLVVLSLLTLFTLLMVTFIIVSGQYRQSALSAARVSRVDPSPTKLLDNATFALLRDSTDPKNPIRFHSLLFDMYGGDGFVGKLSGVSDVTNSAGTPSDGTGGNFFDIRLSVQNTNPATPTDLAGNYYPLSFLDGQYNGCVITIVSSSVAQGRSFRVVEYIAHSLGPMPTPPFPLPTQHKFRLMPIASSEENSNVRPAVGDRIVLNGRPFNGTGFGYDSTTSSTSPKLNPIYALQPNQLLQSNATQLANFVSGDADESYDTVDTQNMPLAAIIPTSTSVPQYYTTSSFGGQVTNGLDTSTSTSVQDGVVVIPSFHRMALINYWMNDSSYAARLDRAIMRPMPWNHPDFDGSNPQLTLAKSATPIRPGDTNFPTDPATQQFLWKLRGIDPLTGNRINPWDVDNDGDRIPDSIWLDLGFPTQTMPDGKQVRPLFAFLCTDLDGRINLNAVGSFGQVTGYQAPNTATSTLARNVLSSTLPTGQGLGVAEINPTAGTDPLFTNAQHRAMIESRYGANRLAGANGMDTFAAVKLFEFPTNYFTGTTAKAYNSPPDLLGELAFGLDHRGQPTFDTPNVSRTDLLSNSPYEFDVTGLQRGRADNPFTVAELERVLRFTDTTSPQLPTRITSLGGITGSTSRLRSVTTESFDVPVPPVVSLPESRSDFEMLSTQTWQNTFPFYNSNRPLHVADLLASRLSKAGVIVDQDDINAEVTKMLSWDLRAGTRMDVNRPFGNGQDDNGNGVVDEHGPTSAQQLEADPSVAEQIWAAGTYFDHDNDGYTPAVPPVLNKNPDPDAYLARYHFARHLYVLAMTLRESSVNIDFDGDTTNDSALETARGLAQWAINVVDFRDADSIMTPFEFDTNPFNGWDVDGVLGSADDSHLDRALVWGCERPELLIKESLAFHDRRTEDLSSPAQRTTRTDSAGNVIGETDFEAGTGANDFDQRLRPRGGLFFELYNPWSGESKRPAEFYSDGTTLKDGVVLNKRAPTVVGGALDGVPVWRMIVVGGASHGPPLLDPDARLDPKNLAPLFSPSHVERGVYFVDPSSLPADPSWVGTGESGHGIQRHYPNGAVAELLPGRYAVVGTQGYADGTGSLATTIGRRTDAKDNGQSLGTSDLKLDQTRRIVLSPNLDPNVNQVQVVSNGLGEPVLPEIKPAIAVAMNRGFDTASGAAKNLNFSLSEPLNGYPNAYNGSIWDSTLASGEGAYEPPIDAPLDDIGLPGHRPDIVSALDLDPEDSTDNRNAYTANLRTVYLQRLANPLLPYDAATNPYLTIDQAPIDLTVFEGVHDPDDAAVPLPAPRSIAGVPFGSEQRGTTDSAQSDGRKLWYSIEQLPPRPLPVGDSHVFNYRVDHSLGFLNRSYGTRFNTTDSVPTEFVGAPNSTSSVGHPFPWLTWNNRPFVSQHEMMLVPHTRSSQLLRQYSVNTTADIYKGATPPARQFGHLLNFFGTTYFDYGAAPPAWQPGPNLYRLFDYTHVPSRFMGTETWLNPSTFASGNGTELLHPPFDRIFSFREPGKVNVNTTFEQRVWDAIRGPNSTLQNFNTLVDSRRGYDMPAGYSPTVAGDRAIVMDKTVPTFVGNAFRAPDAGDLVPVDSMKRAGVEATLLRSPTLTPDSASNPHTEAQKDGSFGVTSGGAHIDPDRNPYFRYQNMQRLSNLVTTRSNVYAIWVTMGLFEVNVEETFPTSGVFVERLGQEAGRETGSVKRHRAFYIVDRSIPVAFQPGENHNVENAILLRRIIE